MRSSGDGGCFTVALVGADGVGKTTIARHLEAHSGLPIKYFYMGDNPRASNVTLPTTRWWKARQVKVGELHRRRGPWRGLLRPIRKSLGFVHRIAEETYRQQVASSFRRRGFIVVFDRHFLLDYWHTDVESTQRPFKRRLHGYLLKHLLREPDLVICLDAPGEVAWLRKREFTPEALERRRLEYRELAARVRHFDLVDADRPLEHVAGDVLDHIERFRRAAQHAPD